MSKPAACVMVHTSATSHRIVCDRLQACQPRDAGAASLIKLDIASHPASEAREHSDRVPAGPEFWSVNVQITQLEVVFLYRFLQVSRQLSSAVEIVPKHSIA